MTIPTYTPGYPPDGSTLGGTKVVIRNNLDGTFETLGVDHVNNNGEPGSNPAGYHNVIRQVTQVADPSVTSPGVNQIYSKNYTTPAGTQTQLFTLNSGGGISQLTGTNGTVQGWQWLGGVLMQWGEVTISGAAPYSGTVDFVTRNGTSTNGINFTTNCFNVVTGFTSATTPNILNTSTAVVAIDTTAINKFGFKWNMNKSGLLGLGGFYWIAIGD